MTDRLPINKSMDAQPVVYGLVLAGGDSQRMGADKAALEFAGQTLLDRAVTVMQPLLDRVFVSARAEQQKLAGRSKYPFIADTVDAPGPAAGILSAHQIYPDVAWLVLAIDMPLVGHDVLETLLRERAPEYAGTAWRGRRGDAPEPLCAVYEPATLAGFLQQVLGGGDPSPQRWLSRQRVKLLDRPAGAALEGANTPRELASRLASKKGRQE